MFPRLEERTLKDRRLDQMSEKKQTFIDQKTGEEIESTRLAKVFGKLCLFLSWAMVLGLVFGLALGTLKGFGTPLFEGIAGSILIAVISSLVVTNSLASYYDVSGYQIVQLTHDGIARAQHFRRQQFLKRKLLEEEWAGVPAKALTLVDRSTSPQVTDTSVSRSEPPEEEKERLTEAVEEGESLAEQKGSAI